MSRELIHTKTEKKANKSPETQLRIEPLRHTSHAKRIKGKETKNQNQRFNL
jgi:hypothetical protein